MDSITIITIVVVALLTLIVFGLSWLSYYSCLKTYRLEVELGKHDNQIKKQFNKKHKKRGEWLGLIGSWVAFSLLLSLFVTGLVYRISGNNISFNNQVALVIKSGSMSDFYNEERAIEYNYDTSLHFNVGDICVYDKINADEDLTIGDVYGYKYKDIIITHRLISYNSEDEYKFRGDNNPSYDRYVSREDIIYHYTGNKVPGIGSFVLFAQSYFGLWSLVGIVGVAVSSEVVQCKINKIEKERLEVLNNEK